MLGADGQANGSGGDALIRKFLRAELAVGGGCRMDDQGFDVSHVGKQGEDFQTVDKLPGCLLIALDLKGEDGAATIGEVFLIQGMVGVIGQANLLPDRIWQSAFSKALGRSTTPSHRLSPGAAHSSKTEILPKQGKEVVFHFGSRSFL